MRLYIHIPFCIQTCSYCDFCTESNASQHRINKYLDTLLKELSFRLKPYKKLKSIYIGGGTPSRLNTMQIQRILNALNPWISQDLEEFSFEIDPGTLSPSKIEVLLKYNVNRVSVGIQSFDNQVLKQLGRIHSAQLAIKTINMLSSVGFNISADLIIGLPSHTNRIQKDIKRLSSLPIKHCSLYILSLEQGTKLYNQVKKQQIVLPNDTETVKEYNIACKLLEQNGFKQYEISNFARNNHISLHNTAYWTYQKYIGIGTSAAGFDGIKRYVNSANIDTYISNWQNDCQIESLSPLTQQQEKAMVGLRLRSGIQLYKFPLIQDKLIFMLNNKLLETYKDNLRIPQKYLSNSNEILENLF